MRELGLIIALGDLQSDVQPPTKKLSPRGFGDETFAPFAFATA